MFINSFYPTLFRSADFEGFKHWQPVLHFSLPQTQRACIFFILLLLPNSRTITDVVLSKIYNILPSNHRMSQHSWSKNNKESPRLYRHWLISNSHLADRRAVSLSMFWIYELYLLYHLWWNKFWKSEYNVNGMMVGCVFLVCKLVVIKIFRANWICVIEFKDTFLGFHLFGGVGLGSHTN